jgi:OOP family OmpA-OmpF porin
MIVGPERRRIERLEERPEVSGESVAKVLPEAVSRSREELSVALESPMTDAIRTVARREADLFGEILSPTVGAAVRKAVAEAIAAMMQKFNEALERSLSARSLRWRIEARRTGRPFAEVVLLRTLVYRVEEVFLIHSQTGLVLERATAEGAGVLEPDQVTSMLEAIDSFMREAFAPQTGGMHVGQIQFGDLSLWVDRAPQIAVAAIVRGAVPADFAAVLRDARERITLAHQADLARFQSDVAPFSATRPVLERCLKAQRLPAPKRVQRGLAVAAAIGVALAGILGAFKHARTVNQARMLAGTTTALSSLPGVIVTSAGWDDHRIRVQGLRDPLASSPEQELTARGLPEAKLELAPYLSLDPPIVVRRAEQTVGLPEGVVFDVVGATLRARGVAPRLWIERARQLVPVVPGVAHYDDGDLRAQEAVDALRLASSRLERVEIRFPLQSAEPLDAVALRRARAGATGVATAATDTRSPVCLSVSGHADPSGPEEQNQELSGRRARAIADDLIAHGVDRGIVRPIGRGVWRDAGTAARARSVTFTVGLGCAGSP